MSASRWGRRARARPLAARCPICLDDVEADAGLPCGHGVCSACFVKLVESKVDSGQVSAEDLACPLPSCRVVMPEEQLATLVRMSGSDGLRLHERLLDLQAQRFVPEAGGGERFVCCPSPGCEKVLLDEGLVLRKAEVLCPTCEKSFCAACAGPSHPGVTCEDAELERMDPRLRELIARRNWKRCPVCRSLVERESGCNFMTCSSERCQGKSHFCYLCEELLTKAEHASHYEGFDGAIGRMGPFGSVCWNHREVDLSLPSKPPPPELSVVGGDEEGSIALRITWGFHRSEPPTTHYRVQLSVPGTDDIKSTSAHAGDPYYDFKRLQRYRRYQAAVTAVNVNGAGPTSELSDVVYLHPREVVRPVKPAEVAPKPKRWAAR